MYDRQYNKQQSKEKKDIQVSYIETDIQNKVLRDQADRLLYTELIKTVRHAEGGEDDTIDIYEEDRDTLQPIETPTSNIEKLQNLVCAMGRTFHEILVSNRSERKIFSIALSQYPDSELKRIFRLGARLGFLHEARIGTKDGSGRTFLYVLNRCFAPLFTLDPTSFQGYLYMTNADLHEAIRTGRQLRRVKDDVYYDDDVRQLTFNEILTSDDILTFDDILED
jgi:hypothetical protein